MKNKIVRWSWLLGWAVLTALVAAAVRGVAWREAARAVAGADAAWLALAVAANAAILMLTSARWRLFLPRGTSLSAPRMFAIAALASSVANGGPPLAGQAAGIQLLATRGGLGHAGGVSVTLMDQVAEGAAKWLIVALAAATVPAFTYRSAGLTILLGAPLLGVGAALLARHGHLLARLESRAAGRTAGVLRFLSDAVHHLEALRRPGRFAAAVALTVVQKGAEAAGIAAAAAALAVHLPLWAIVGALVAVNLSTMVSVTPANLGIYEGAAFLVYRAAGLAPDTALALAVLQHVLYLIPLAGIGWVILTAEGARIGRGRRAGAAQGGGPEPAAAPDDGAGSASRASLEARSRLAPRDTEV